MPSQFSQRMSVGCAVMLCTLWLQAQDLHIKKNIIVGGHPVSSTDTSIKGARERTVQQAPGGMSTVTLRQCDLKRTVTLNEGAQTYFVNDDPQDDSAARAAALATGAAMPESSGGKITVTTVVTDTGERKTMFGYPARHLKAKVNQESSANACMQVKQSFEIDGWFADISKEQSACAQIAPPVQQANGCHDTVVSHHSGSGKLGYPLVQTITMPSPDGNPTTVTIQTSELSKQPLPADLFDVPSGYRQVNSLAELHGAPQATQAAYAPQQPAAGQYQNNMQQGMNPAMAGNAMGMQQAAMAQAQAQMQMMQGGGRMAGMPGNQMQGAPVAAPQALGPKAPGKIRIGVAPPDAQVGQGSNAGADYSTPIRNAEIALMSGPAIEIAPLDSRIPMQLQAEAQQKQCDYIMFSAVTVKHGSSGGFGKFMKMGGTVASMTPVGMATRGMGAAAAAQVAGQAASAVAMQSAQQQAMNQLSGFNGQIKSKDEVAVQYQLVQTGQTTAVVANSLTAKAKSDGEDVLTPLLQQTATTVLTQVSKH